MNTLFETDTLVFGQEADQVRALGLMAVLASVTDIYARDELFRFTQTCSAAIEMKCYGILYERQDKEAVLKVPVGFMTWGMFNKTTALIFKNRLRMLQRDDFTSGKQMWLLDIVAPFGHYDDMMAGFDLSVGREQEEYKLTRAKAGQPIREGTVPNKNLKAKIAAAKERGRAMNPLKG